MTQSHIAHLLHMDQDRIMATSYFHADLQVLVYTYPPIPHRIHDQSQKQVITIQAHE